MIKKRKLIQFEELAEKQREMLESYMKYLLEYNKKINLISRRVTEEKLTNLIWETCFLNCLISKSTVVDAGSGNGLLGIPIAILDKNKKVILVESKVKKQNFLIELKTFMGLENIVVQKSDINHFFNHPDKNIKEIALVARGFPDLNILVSHFIKKKVDELLIITSKRKIIKMKKGMESAQQKIYNIPFRNNIVVWNMENVSRETRPRKK